jgi:rod shape-determining protein MreD
MEEYIKYSIALLVLVIIQKSLIWLIAITDYHITPDIVLIGLVYIGIKKGKITGSVGGFIVGLIYDFLSFLFLGLMAFSKSTAGFIAGFFNNENKIERYTKSYIFVFIVFFCSVCNNIIYFTLYFQGTSLSFQDIILRYVIPGAIYTAFFSIIAVILTRKNIIGR